MVMTREQFEQYFSKLQAFQEFDMMRPNENEKELIRQLCMGEISTKDYDRKMLDEMTRRNYVEEVDLDPIQAAMRVWAVHSIKRLHKEDCTE